MSHLEARRVVDFFRPGDVIPAGHYPPATLQRLLEKGLVVEVDDAPVEQAAEQQEPPVEPPAPRRIARKGHTGQL